MPLDIAPRRSQTALQPWAPVSLAGTGSARKISLAPAKEIWLWLKWISSILGKRRRRRATTRAPVNFPAIHHSGELWWPWSGWIGAREGHSKDPPSSPSLLSKSQSLRTSTNSARVCSQSAICASSRSVRPIRSNLRDSWMRRLATGTGEAAATAAADVAEVELLASSVSSLSRRSASSTKSVASSGSAVAGSRTEAEAAASSSSAAAAEEEEKEGREDSRGEWVPAVAATEPPMDWATNGCGSDWTGASDHQPRVPFGASLWSSEGAEAPPAGHVACWICVWPRHPEIPQPRTDEIRVRGCEAAALPLLPLRALSCRLGRRRGDIQVELARHHRGEAQVC